ncbi:MAG TPA: hypothetical protein VKA81_09370 [Verrucomicrobiae bacterium]|nr:hypothetical protein [Verrucomicrobiae bacterium]
MELPLITFDDSLSVHFNGEEIKVNDAPAIGSRIGAEDEQFRLAFRVAGDFDGLGR